mgnify:CR=1 FL=1
MKMLALTDGFDNLPDIGAVLEDGVADIQILESDLVSDRNVIENLERNGLVLFHDPASQFLTGLHAFHGDDADAVAALLPQVKLGIRLIDGAQHIYLNGEDVSTAIRAEEIGMAASAVAAHPAVRSFLLDTQRGLAESQNILMDGRDIGTVVLPNATVKIFLTASAEARAQRRAKELAEKGQPADFATVLADIRQRDYQDSHRAVAPLKQADDAILVDTSSIGLPESFDLLKRTILAHI